MFWPIVLFVWSMAAALLGFQEQAAALLRLSASLFGVFAFLGFLWIALRLIRGRPPLPDMDG